nr:uncharacterized protein LOC111770701 [Equus caballus]
MPGRRATCPPSLGTAVLSRGVLQVCQVQTTRKKLIRPSVAEASLPGPQAHSCLGHEGTSGPFGRGPGRDRTVPAVRSFRGSAPLAQGGPRPQSTPLTRVSPLRLPGSAPQSTTDPQSGPCTSVPPRRRAFLLSQPERRWVGVPGPGPAPPAPRAILPALGGWELLLAPAPCAGPRRPRGPGSQPGYDSHRLCDLGQVTARRQPQFPPLPSGDRESSRAARPRGGAAPGETLCEPLGAAGTPGSQGSRPDEAPPPALRPSAGPRCWTARPWPPPARAPHGPPARPAPAPVPAPGARPQAPPPCAPARRGPGPGGLRRPTAAGSGRGGGGGRGRRGGPSSAGPGLGDDDEGWKCAAAAAAEAVAAATAAAALPLMAGPRAAAPAAPRLWRGGRWLGPGQKLQRLWR